MDLVVQQFMQRNVHTISPEATLPELEEVFLQERVGGLPVVQDGKVIGIVSRSDIVRQLYQEHQLAESTSDFYRDEAGFHELPLVTFEQVADRVGERIEQLRVRDVMSTHLFAVSPDQPLRHVAQMLVDHRVHRLLVTEDKRLLGIVTALDLAGLIANGRVRTAA